MEGVLGMRALANTCNRRLDDLTFSSSRVRIRQESFSFIYLWAASAET